MEVMLGDYFILQRSLLDFHNSSSAMAQSDTLPNSNIANTDQTFHYFTYIELMK